MNKDLKKILNNLTLEEKIGQLQQLSGHFYLEGSSEITGPILELSGLDDVPVELSGSVLGMTGAKNTRQVQEAYLKNSNHEIPLLFMADIVHGYKTIFPIPLGLASSWDANLAKRSAEIAAKEAAVSGVHVTFAPMVDLVRDPRWGRVLETTGEDPYINGVFAKAFTEGFQGKNLKYDFNHVAACVKHFIGYGAGEAGRDYNTVDMSQRHLFEYHLPAFNAAIAAGVKLVMTSFNLINGVPMTANKELLRDFLRDETGFKGVIISDWGAVKESIPHGIAADEKAAAKLAIEASCDIEMMTFTYEKHLKELIKEGVIDVSILDEAVMRILQLKEDLGLFDNPYRGASESDEKKYIFSKENKDIALEAAEKSIVLMKNENKVLPLKKDQRIALIGPFVNNSDLLGAWSWLGEREETDSLFDVLKHEKNIDFIPFKSVWSMNENELERSLEFAEKADLIILALGESSDHSGEAKSRSNINLPNAQINLVRALSKIDKPKVAILFNGRPLDLSDLDESVDGLLEAWYPGTMGAEAVRKVLYGEKNPQAKLTMSFPHNVGQVPVYYNAYNTGRPMDAKTSDPEYSSKFLDVPNSARYPFGFGLSYSEFHYSNFELINGPKIRIGESIKATVTISNKSDIIGVEIVQWYVRDLIADVSRPLKELKAYESVNLDAFETKTITVEINTSKLEYYNHKLKKKVDPGMFVLMVGTSSEKTEALEFEIIK